MWLAMTMGMGRLNGVEASSPSDMGNGPDTQKLACIQLTIDSNVLCFVLVYHYEDVLETVRARSKSSDIEDHLPPMSPIDTFSQIFAVLG
jgi:hypothetical protein